jgi:hypothetical protein
MQILNLIISGIPYSHFPIRDYILDIKPPEALVLLDMEKYVAKLGI